MCACIYIYGHKAGSFLCTWRIEIGEGPSDYIDIYIYIFNPLVPKVKKDINPPITVLTDLLA